ncbi:MAG: sugar ABC transporter permease [Armatimonadota bacterium]|nr:sugar ABC transporter permease [Armatimonadota bacterium]MDR7500394.1 sugar ABC transporter permease [Armatimonadota bacterium]MDR7548042.1 sugar ABC transporter permease [Armatimonadota bacterium]
MAIPFGLLLIPALWAVYQSLTNAALAGVEAIHPKFIGLQNYVTLLRDPGFRNSLSVSLKFLIWSALVGQFLLGMTAAVALRRNDLKMRDLFGAIILLPLAVPEIVVAFMWTSFLAPGEFGSLNRLLRFVGISASANWFYQYPLPSVILINIWRGVTFATILFLSGLQTIPTELEEAGAVDGGSPRQVFQYITLPLLMPVIFTYMILTTITTLSIFGLIYALTRGGPGGATEVVPIYMYNRAFQFYQLGYGSAVAVVMLIVALTLGFIYVRSLRVML